MLTGRRGVLDRVLARLEDPDHPRVFSAFLELAAEVDRQGEALDRLAAIMLTAHDTGILHTPGYPDATARAELGRRVAHLLGGPEPDGT